ncbi:uncharacterized protein SCHCODRAFT_02619984 [Schizophyllum commune H4-8]|uniref:uncharacterized protein n=1 Tax=Schizophyllum commune (strain H4-8 / FGSC 9210) TaxID=578458 RepID=UPI00215E59A2|nr:uncharacterized protein SCHCODRAFT_02619984 [Schizophyllum commune H4-8]KAI5895642.1 hypothetical protein SCHCODRAFT_02619984 [Schizophyllum commune H4-8]
MGSAGGWLCASRSALALMVVGQWRGGVVWWCEALRASVDGRRPASALVTSQRNLNREITILGEKLRNDVCHRC